MVRDHKARYARNREWYHKYNTERIAARKAYLQTMVAPFSLPSRAINLLRFNIVPEYPHELTINLVREWRDTHSPSVRGELMRSWPNCGPKFTNLLLKFMENI